MQEVRYASMLKSSNVFYGWIVVSISTLVFAIVRGVNDAFSVFFVALLEEFGWSRAAVAGVDVVTAQGTEAGGHTGLVSTLPLVPAVVDAVAPVPVIAAGGIADGRGIAAALMLGAEGVWIGTRFLATRECGVSDAYKARVVAATGDDTVLTDVFDIAGGMPWPDGVSGRAIRNRFSERWERREEELRTWAIEHGDEYRSLGPDAEIAEKAVWAGEAASFVTGVESAADVVRGLVADAAGVLTARPQAVLRDR